MSGHSDNDINIRIKNSAGRITLTRPKFLNALTHEMVLAIYDALIGWQEDPTVKFVIIDGLGEKSFCAGGDIQKLYQTGIKGEYVFMRNFWRDEYRLNALIADYAKPFIAIMDGIVMGGGVGISSHGSHRIVTERTMLAMPECAIGLVPDVGGSFLLANAPGHIGEYMGLAGARLNAADAIFARFADTFVSIKKIDALMDELLTTGDINILNRYTSDPGASLLVQSQPYIEDFFDQSNALSAFNKLEQSNLDWAQSTVKKIRSASPLSVACTWQMIQNAREFNSLEEALINEYRFVWRSIEEGDVLEGTRALIIDKDKNPQWRINSLEEVTDQMVSSMLAPLGKHKLSFDNRQEK